MMHRALVVLVVIAMCSAMSGLAGPRSPATARAQSESDVPALGDVVLADPLSGTGPFRPTACPSGKNNAEFVEEGLRMRVTGTCSVENPINFVGATAGGLVATNGEIAIDTKVVEGQDRAWMGLYFRAQTNGDAYYFTWIPSTGQARLRKGIKSISVLLAENGDVGVVEPDSWTRLAIRFSGRHLWGFVNDQLVVSATDASLSTGAVEIGAGRFDGPDDTSPVSVVWRNLQVTALAGAPAPASAPSAAAAPIIGTPPVVGRVIHQEPLTERGIIPSGTCPTGKGRGEVVGDGFLLAVRGKCSEQSTSAGVGPSLLGLTVPDGETRFELKFTNGYERAVLGIAMRVAKGSLSGYGFTVAPGRGSAVILDIHPGAASPPLASRNDVAGLLHRDDWNTFAVRVSGRSLWLLVNDQPVLSAENDTYDTGGVGIGLSKLGNPDDDEEVAVVVRNLTVSAIEGAPDERTPTYVRPNGPPNGPGQTLSLSQP